MAETAVRAEFFTEAILQGHETEKQGRPIYKDMELVKIVVAGSREEVVRLVEPDDKVRFSDAWRRFKDSNAEITDGTPLKMWPPLTPSLIRHFDNFNIRTVEMLGEMSDANCAQMGPGTREWRDKAKAWLGDAASSAESLARIDENKRLHERIAALEAMVATLGAEKQPDEPTPSRKSRAA